jgi:hypothetical protein
MWDRCPSPLRDYVLEAATIVTEICSAVDTDKKKDILIFLPSKMEFTMLESHLKAVNKKLASDGHEVFVVISVNRQTVITENIDFQRMTEDLDYTITIDGNEYMPTRRIILANSVAETGLTLDDLKHVIDSGYHFGNEYNPILRCEGIWTTPTPKARWQQRRGRVGRKFPGVYWPLYPKYIWDKLDLLQKPAILTDDISAVFIDIITEQYKRKWTAGDSDPEFIISDIDMIDIPSPDMLLMCMEKFYALGFISTQAPRWNPVLSIIAEDPQIRNRHGLTMLGCLYSKFATDNISLECSRMILAATTWNINILDLITISAYLSLDLPLVLNPSLPLDMSAIYKLGLPSYLMSPDIVLKIKCLISDDFIDGLIIYQAMEFICSSATIGESVVTMQKWCKTVNISYEGMISFLDIRDKQIDQFLKAEFNVFYPGNRLANVPQESLMDIICRYKHCIYDGFRCNVLTLRDGAYYTDNNLQVTVPSLFKGLDKKIEASGHTEILKFMPVKLLYQRLDVKLNRKTKLYVVQCGKYSVMDGFVSTDDNFIL